MPIVRDPGEVYLQGNTMGGTDTTAWLERIDPESLEVVERSPDLAGGRFWAGGVAAHANGSLYVTYGRWCHRLGPDCQPIASRELPRERPYNSSVILPDGHLVTKDFGGGTGMHRLPDGVTGSELVVLEPDGLEVVERLELPEGSIARLSAAATTDRDDAVLLDAFVYVIGDTHAFRYAWDSAACTLELDDEWTTRYRIFDGQTFGWDVVIEGDSAWFLDNGQGTEAFGPSFRGKGTATAPLHLIRIPLASGEPTYLEVCGETGGLIANPPAIDSVRRIAVGYDSGNGVITAWRYSFPGQAELLWQRHQDHAGHMIRFAETGELVTYDFDHDRGTDQCVVLDIETGNEKGRVDTGSPVQCVLFPSVGWSRDFYIATFMTITRVFIA